MKSLRIRSMALCLTVMSLVIAIHPAVAGKSVPVIPVSGTSTRILVADKAQTYYALGGSNKIVLEIDGPGRLQCISRFGLPTGTGATGEYEITIAENGSAVRTNASKTDAADAHVGAGGRVVGKMRKFSVKVPEGPHTYTVSLSKPAQGEAFARFRFTPSKGRRNLVTLEALSYQRIVTAMVKEKLITYYVATGERPVQLRVIGPTQVKVSARLNYDAKMKGGQRYAVMVKEHDTPVMTKALATSKAVGATYQEWRDVVPGKMNAFTLQVPDGEHVYSFALGESIGQSVSLKFSIPKGDLDNEK